MSRDNWVAQVVSHLCAMSLKNTFIHQQILHLWLDEVEDWVVAEAGSLKNWHWRCGHVV